MLNFSVPLTVASATPTSSSASRATPWAVVIVPAPFWTEKPDEVSLTPHGPPTAAVPQPLLTLRLKSSAAIRGSGAGALPTWTLTPSTEGFWSLRIWRAVTASPALRPLTGRFQVPVVDTMAVPGWSGGRPLFEPLTFRVAL